MAEKEIALLKQQKEKLEDKKFDLEAWKNHTIIFLERIFGKDSTKIKMIKALHYDYSSWNLRDVAAAGKSKDPVRIQADEILDAAITELEQLGIPEQTRTNERLWELIQDELTGKQIREIESISGSDAENKTEKLKEILKTIEKEGLLDILVQLLIS